MNDSKYERLYPERAVAKAREILKTLAGFGGSGSGGCQEALDDLDQLGFPPDEPLFLLRGQDDLAPETVRFYAYEWGRRLDILDAPEGANRIVEIADRMAAWEPRKLPD